MFRHRTTAHAHFVNTLACRLAFPAVIACGVFVPALARAASLSGPVSGWSSGVPSYISMYEYVPAKVAASPPIVVAAHFCGGSASAMFGSASSIVAKADQLGFIMIFPQTTNPASSADCWDVGSKASLTHDGGGDTQAIAEMVKYEISKRNANANRVYVMGISSGAMLTEAMLAVYPDIFKAGAEFSGVPAGCWTDGWTPQSNWGGICAKGNDNMSAQQWGDLVRGMYPGYSGYRPRVQLWHGTADMTIDYKNQGEAIKEWTNVLGLNATPNSTDTTSVPNFTIQKWQNTCGFTVLEAHTQANGGHTTPIDANSVISFFGLDKSAATDPEVAMCSGTGGSGGAGSGGGSGVGGSGVGGTGAGGSNGVGGGSSFGGSSSGVGGSGAGAGNSFGGTGSGGTFGGGGLTGSAGAPNGAGGASVSGSGGQSHAGAPGAGNGNIAGATTSGSTGDEPASDNSAGCSCDIAGGRNSTGAFGALALAVLGTALGRRKRRS